MENTGNADFRDCDFVEFYIKNMSNLLLCRDGILVIMV
jgi:hypothetical protein